MGTKRRAAKPPEIRCRRCDGMGIIYAGTTGTVKCPECAYPAWTREHKVLQMIAEYLPGAVSDKVIFAEKTASGAKITLRRGDKCVIVTSQDFSDPSYPTKDELEIYTLAVVMAS